MASGDVARCRNLCAALLLLSAILLVPAESSMKSIEQLVVRPYVHYFPLYYPHLECLTSFSLFISNSICMLFLPFRSEITKTP
jgi:hypothetical protein